MDDLSPKSTLRTIPEQQKPKGLKYTNKQSCNNCCLQENSEPHSRCFLFDVAFPGFERPRALEDPDFFVLAVKGGEGGIRTRGTA